MALFKTLKKIANFGSGGQHEIDDFKSAISKRGGLSRPNRFLVIMTPPGASLINTDWQGHISSALAGNFGFNDLINDPRDMALLCQSCSFPGKQINTIDHDRSGFANPVKAPYQYTMEDVTFTFHLTNDYFVKKQFDNWQNTVLNPRTHTIGWKKNYTSSVVIQQLDQSNTNVYGIKLVNAYPVAVNSIQLDNSTTDSTHQVSVTMAYDYYEPQGAIDSMVSGAKGLLDGVKNLF
tara:strand:+ start:3456 stop:4160 length:705 start_codon:yes stop_codon:yes gene_type:complete